MSGEKSRPHIRQQVLGAKNVRVPGCAEEVAKAEITEDLKRKGRLSCRRLVPGCSLHNREAEK